MQLSRRLLIYGPSAVSCESLAAIHMDDRTFHHKYIKTPRFYMESFVKVFVGLLLMTLVFIFFPTSQANLSTPTLIGLFSVILIATSIYLFTRKYVNYVKLDYKDKTIEVFYLEPFRESTIKTNFDNFDFSYYTKTYDFLFKIRTWKVLKMNLDHCEFKISERELTFSLETMIEMVNEFEKIKST